MFQKQFLSLSWYAVVLRTFLLRITADHFWKAKIYSLLVNKIFYEHSFIQTRGGGIKEGKKISSSWALTHSATGFCKTCSCKMHFSFLV